MRQVVEGTSYTERQAALEAKTQSVRDKGERDLAALRAQTVAVNERVRRDVEALEQAERDTKDRCATALATAFHTELAPHVRAWMHEPTRQLANAIADACRRYDGHAQHELGESLWESAIACAFAAVIVETHPRAANSFAQNTWGSGSLIELLAAFRRSLCVGPPNIQAALEAIEIELQAVAVRATAELVDRNVRRFALKQSCATHSDSSRKLAAFDAREEAQRTEEFARSYEPPERFTARALRALGI